MQSATTEMKRSCLEHPVKPQTSPFLSRLGCLSDQKLREKKKKKKARADILGNASSWSCHGVGVLARGVGMSLILPAVS